MKWACGFDRILGAYWVLLRATLKCDNQACSSKEASHLVAKPGSCTSTSGVFYFNFNASFFRNPKSNIDEAEKTQIMVNILLNCHINIT